MADPIALTDLDVIRRYSVAVRSATVDRDELVEVLQADLAWLEAGRAATRARRTPTVDVTSAPKPTPRPSPARSRKA